MTKIALIQPPQLQPWEAGELERIGALVHANPAAGFQLVARPADADLVVLLESCSFKTQHDIPAYRALLAEHGARRLLCINYEDGPPGFLPGLHSSLEDWRFDAALHLSWPHLRLPNALADSAGPATEGTAPPLLFTFSGACSHPLRRALFERWEGCSGPHKVREIKRWYDHSADEHQQYVRDILDSRFVLCPRGIASYSHRIAETLALGRVPVVIADHWVPFSIPEQGWYLRVEESRLGELETVLSRAAVHWPALRQLAAAVYRRWFEPAQRYTVALQRLCRLQRELPVHMDNAFLQQRWSSRDFWHRNGWCLEQRVARRLRRLVAA